jgi:hypothetical protein
LIIPKTAIRICRKFPGIAKSAGMTGWDLIEIQINIF